MDKLVIKAKHPKGEDGYKTFSIRVKSEIVEEVEEISRITGRSRNELISILLKFALENYKIQQ